MSYFPPSMAGASGFADWIARYCRRSTNPQAAVAPLPDETDLASILPAVRVLTVVMNRVADRDAIFE